MLTDHSCFLVSGLMVCGVCVVFSLLFFITQSPAIHPDLTYSHNLAFFFPPFQIHGVLYLAGIWKDAVDNSLLECCLAGLFCSKSGFQAGALIQGEKPNCPIADGSRWAWKGRWELGVLRPQADTEENGSRPGARMPLGPFTSPFVPSLPVSRVCSARGELWIKNYSR